MFDSSVPKAFLPSYTVMDDLHKNLVSERKQTQKENKLWFFQFHVSSQNLDNIKQTNFWSFQFYVSSQNSDNIKKTHFWSFQFHVSSQNSDNMKKTNFWSFQFHELERFFFFLPMILSVVC